MPQRSSVRPTRPILVFGLIAAVAFLIFGAVFLSTLVEEGSGVGVAFMVFWIFIILLIIGYWGYLLVGRKAVIEIDTESRPSSEGPAPDFEKKLRQLELLRKDGLVTDEEYRAKREEILKQPW